MNLKGSGYIRVDTQDEFYLYMTTKAKDYVQDIQANDGDKDAKKCTHMWVLRKQQV